MGVKGSTALGAWFGLLPVMLLGAWRFFQGGWIGWDCLSSGRRGVAPTICVDPYWLNQWLKNYAGGFTKRGLIGEVLRHVLPGDLDLLLVTLVALALLLLCYGLLYWLLLRVVARSLLFASLLASLLVLSPLGKVLAETALDPLQLCVLLLVVVLLTPVRSPQRDGVLLLVYALSSLIYEGCALLLLPFVLVLMRPGASRWLPVGLAMVFLLVFQRPDPAGLGEMASAALRAVNPWTGQSLRYQEGGGMAASVSFLFNVKQEFTRYGIDPPRETISRVSRSLGVVLAYLLVLLTAIGQGRNPSRALLLRNWLLLAPFALPFVLITHDWFRYGVILLLVALLLTAAQVTPAASKAWPLPGWRLASGEAWSLLPVSAMVLIGPASADVRKCLPHNYFHASLGMLGLAAVVYWLSLRFPRPAAGGEVLL
jgi:hypothetical protein